MFPKTICRQFGKGQKPRQSLNFSRALLLRWKLGERATLWKDALQAQKCPRAPKEAASPAIGELHRNVERLVMTGRAGQALQRLLSPGLAHDTPAVQAKLAAKFPAPSIPPRSPALVPGNTPEIPAPLLLKALQSFQVGKGPGPDGLRADFLRLLCGETGDVGSFVELVRDFVQLLAEGHAPIALRAWIGGGNPGGHRQKRRSWASRPARPGRSARPIVMGTVWRKLVFKTTFLLDKDSIQSRLAPQQVAVGIRSGAEAMIHAARAWIRANNHKTDYVLLQRDISNAYNSVHTHMFLDECYQYATASSKFAEFCYGAPNHLVYHGRLMQSARGQQGCPLMGSLFCLARKRMYEEACGNARGSHACFDPEFADDGFCGGPVASVWAIFEQEIALAEKYGLHFDMGETTLYLLSGEAFHADLRPFQALGIRIVKGIDIQMLQVPISGREDFYAEWNRLKIAAIDGYRTVAPQTRGLALIAEMHEFPEVDLL